MEALERSSNTLDERRSSWQEQRTTLNGASSVIFKQQLEVVARAVRDEDLRSRPGVRTRVSTSQHVAPRLHTSRVESSQVTSGHLIVGLVVVV
jgi:hypothetical protein